MCHRELPLLVVGRENQLCTMWQKCTEDANLAQKSNKANPEDAGNVSRNTWGNGVEMASVCDIHAEYVREPVTTRKVFSFGVALYLQDGMRAKIL